MTAAGDSRSAKRSAVQLKGKENLQRLEGAVSEPERDNQDDSRVGVDKDNLCFKCNSTLANSPQVINIAGQSRRWHPHCFRCQICREPMDRKQSCHVFRDQILCRADFARLKRDHAVRCARCRWPIAASDWVRRAASHVYHIACFNCDVCMRQLNTGEQFVISNCDEDSSLAVRLLCRLHFRVEAKGRVRSPASSSSPTPTLANKRPPPPPPPQMSDNPTLECLPASNQSRVSPDSYLQLLSARGAGGATPSDVGALEIEAAFKALEADAGPSTSAGDKSNSAPLSLALATSDSSSSAASTPNSLSMHAHYSGAGPLTPTNAGGGGHTHGSNSSSTGGGLACKSKRVRTTFTEDQLAILQTHFQRDSNPDGQDLERIATITGLSKRVTQVWFQNSRARQKKYLIKRKPSDGLPGSSLAARAATNVVNSSLGLPSAQEAESSSPKAQQLASNMSVAEKHLHHRHPHPEPHNNPGEQQHRHNYCISAKSYGTDAMLSVGCSHSEAVQANKFEADDKRSWNPNAPISGAIDGSDSEFLEDGHGDDDDDDDDDQLNDGDERNDRDDDEGGDVVDDEDTQFDQDSDHPDLTGRGAIGHEAGEPHRKLSSG